MEIKSTSNQSNKTSFKLSVTRRNQKNTKQTKTNKTKHWQIAPDFKCALEQIQLREHCKLPDVLLIITRDLMQSKICVRDLWRQALAKLGDSLKYWLERLQRLGLLRLQMGLLAEDPHLPGGESLSKLLQNVADCCRMMSKSKEYCFRFWQIALWNSRVWLQILAECLTEQATQLLHNSCRMIFKSQQYCSRFLQIAFETQENGSRLLQNVSQKKQTKRQPNKEMCPPELQNASRCSQADFPRAWECCRIAMARDFDILKALAWDSGSRFYDSKETRQARKQLQRRPQEKKGRVAPN